MDQFSFPYKNATRTVSRRAQVGVVGSGDMEVIMTPSAHGYAHVTVTTSVSGFQSTWLAMLDRFFSRFDGAVEIIIHDAGATPGSVLLRLQQAVEVLER